MTPMDFSIVVPFFNAGEFIERCAQALVTLRYPAERYEILMVDNNSTDQSAAIVRRFERIRLLEETRQGSYAARNRGVVEARGEVVAFTDPDCVPRADWLEQLARAMKEPPVKLALGDRQFASDAGVLGMLAAYESELGARIFAGQRVDCYYGYTNNMAVRAATLREVGGFETLLRGADSLFLRRVMETDGSSAVRYVPEALVRHLEIASVHDYLEKKSIYGHVNGNSKVATPGALPLRVRLDVARSARRKVSGSLSDTIGFLGVLAAGAARFEWQRRQGR